MSQPEAGQGDRHSRPDEGKTTTVGEALPALRQSRAIACVHGFHARTAAFARRRFVLTLDKITALPCGDAVQEDRLRYAGRSGVLPCAFRTGAASLRGDARVLRRRARGQRRRNPVRLLAGQRASNGQRAARRQRAVLPFLQARTQVGTQGRPRAQPRARATRSGPLGRGDRRRVDTRGNAGVRANGLDDP